MNRNAIVRLFVATILVLPAFAQATSLMPEISTTVCGHVFNSNDPHSQVEQEGSGYLVRLDCSPSLKKNPSQAGPLAVIEVMKVGHKGTVTKFTQDAVEQAIANKQVSPRAAKAYACMDVRMQENPCVTGAKKVSIYEVETMHAADSVIGKWIGKANQALQADRQAAGQ